MTSKREELLFIRLLEYAYGKPAETVKAESTTPFQLIFLGGRRDPLRTGEVESSSGARPGPNLGE